MQNLMTVQQMCSEWSLPQNTIFQITKDMTPVEYTGHGKWKRGLYNATEVAAALKEETEKKLRRAREAVAYYKRRLRILEPFINEE